MLFFHYMAVKKKEVEIQPLFSFSYLFIHSFILFICFVLCLSTLEHPHNGVNHRKSSVCESVGLDTERQRKKLC